MKQLAMKREAGDFKRRELPEGYKFVSFTGSEKDINDWLEVCTHGLSDDTRREIYDGNITDHPGVNAENDIFFVERISDGKRVATTTAVRHDNGAGYVHMVAANEEIRGLGIGHAMMTHTLEILEGRNCPYSTLTTDDFRLAAIKTYLDDGFRPVIFKDPESDMTERWDKIIKELGYGKVEYIYDERFASMKHGILE